MLGDRSYMRGPSFGARRSATVTIVIVNVVAFILECVLYGYPPRFANPDWLALSWRGLEHGYVWQLLTFQFMHGGILHLFFNCWAIYVFGRELEETLGVKRFLILYFSAGVIGGLCQSLTGVLAEHFGSTHWILRFAAPTVGASAGALGLLAAFATLFPERPLMFLLFFIIPVSMRAKFLLLFSALLSVFGLIFPVSNMADAAHLGGMLTGILFIRYAAAWDWRWPRLRRKQSRRQPMVRVISGGGGGWSSNRNPGVEDLPPEEFLSKEVDPILDKISAQGIQSLTPRERRILEAAREKMARR